MSKIRMATSSSVMDIEQAFDAYGVELFGYFLHRTGDVQASEDLAQDTFLRALRYRESFDENRSLRTWLYGIARNLVADWRRSAASTPEPLPDPLPDPSGLADAALERREAISHVHAALSRLSPTHSEVLILTRLQGLTYRTAADILGTTEGAVKVRVFRALAALRTHLEEEAPHVL